MAIWLATSANIQLDIQLRQRVGNKWQLIRERRSPVDANDEWTFAKHVREIGEVEAVFLNPPLVLPGRLTNAKHGQKPVRGFKRHTMRFGTRLALVLRRPF